MRILRLIHAKYSIFKKVRMGFTLLKTAFKSVFLSHKNYLFLCLMLTTIQFIHLQITGIIHHRTLGFLMTELLAGENFFEILWHDAKFTLSGNNFLTFLKFISLLYLEIILVFFVLCAAAHYAFKQQNNPIRKSIVTSMTHWYAICGWGLIELGAQGLSSVLGGVGALLYFAWNIITIFDVQILSFDTVNAYHVLKKSWKLFLQSFSEVVTLDVIIEGFIVIIGLVIYAISKQYISGINFTELENNDLVVFLILYLISSVMIFEVVVFTNLYKTIEKK